MIEALHNPFVRLISSNGVPSRQSRPTISISPSRTARISTSCAAMGLSRGGVRRLNTPAGTSRTPSRTCNCTVWRRARWNHYRTSALPPAANPFGPCTKLEGAMPGNSIIFQTLFSSTAAVCAPVSSSTANAAPKIVRFGVRLPMVAYMVMCVPLQAAKTEALPRKHYVTDGVTGPHDAIQLR